MLFETDRLIVTEFDLSMAESVHKLSLDEDNRKFLPDEVFETTDKAKEVLNFLIGVYKSKNGPLVYPVLLKNKTHIGHVELVPTKDGFEVGFHIGIDYTNKGYATEALQAFLDYIMPIYNINKIYGICLAENVASRKVLEKSNFIQEYDGIGLYQGKTQHIVKFIYHKSF